jgi:hypothetical protein
MCDKDLSNGMRYTTGSARQSFYVWNQYNNGFPTKMSTLNPVYTADVYSIYATATSSGSGTTPTPTPTPTPSPAPSGGSITIGDTNIENNNDGAHANFIIGERTYIPQSATSTSISIYSGGSGTNAKLAIYSDNNGAPGSLLTQSSPITLTTGWNTASLPATSLAGTNRVWLVWMCDKDLSNGMRYTTGSANQAFYVYRSYTNGFPTTLSGLVYTNAVWSIYATATTSGSGTTTTPTPTPTPTHTATPTPAPTITTQPATSSSGFLSKAMQVGLDYINSNNIHYAPNWANSLHSLGVNTLRLSGGSQGDVWDINMVDNPNTWAQHLETLLELTDSNGFKVYFQTLGDPWGTVLGIDGMNIGYDRTPALVGSNYNRVSLVTSYEIANGYPLTRSYLDKLAGNNPLNHNFLSDPRIWVWSPANEFYIGNAGSGSSNGDLTYNWWVFVADYIRAHGGQVVANNPLYGSNGWDQSFAQTAKYFDGRVGNRHADYIEFHVYAFQSLLNGQYGYSGSSKNWGAWKNDLQNALAAYTINRGNFDANNIILGEFGIWDGYGDNSGVSGTFSSADVTNYFNYYFQALNALSIPIRNTAVYGGFTTQSSNTDFGLITRNGVYLPGCGPISQYYGGWYSGS